MRDSYHVLRELFRIKYKMPLPMRHKFVYNIKESFTVVSTFGSEQEQKQILNNVMKHDLEFLKKLSQLPEPAHQLFDKRLYHPELYNRDH